MFEITIQRLIRVHCIVTQDPPLLSSRQSPYNCLLARRRGIRSPRVRARGTHGVQGCGPAHSRTGDNVPAVCQLSPAIVTCSPDTLQLLAPRKLQNYCKNLQSQVEIKKGIFTSFQYYIIKILCDGTKNNGAQKLCVSLNIKLKIFIE